MNEKQLEQTIKNLDERIVKLSRWAEDLKKDSNTKKCNMKKENEIELSKAVKSIESEVKHLHESFHELSNRVTNLEIKFPSTGLKLEEGYDNEEDKKNDIKASDKTKYIESFKKYFKLLCDNYRLPMPHIAGAEYTDECDFTSSAEIRIQYKPRGTTLDKHVKHTFAHWLCDLHNYGDDRMCHRVTTIIEDLLSQEFNLD
jgi:seryl-tRNA synthetase